MKKRLGLFLVPLFCLFATAITWADVTYTYYGNTYNTIVDDDPPTGSYSTFMSVQGSFTISTALSPNLTDFNLIPNSWLLSDGRNFFNEFTPNYTLNTVFAVSTDAFGDISGWYLNLETDDGTTLRRIHSAFNTGFSALEEDYGYIEVSGQWDQGIISGRHGSWNAVPEPSSAALLAGVAVSLLAGTRRRAC